MPGLCTPAICADSDGRRTYHVETLVSELTSLISRSRVYATALLVLLRCLLDLGNGLFQLVMHCAVVNGMPNIVSQIEGAHKQYVDAWNFCYSIDLKGAISATQRRTRPFRIRFLRLLLFLSAQWSPTNRLPAAGTMNVSELVFLLRYSLSNEAA